MNRDIAMTTWRAVCKSDAIMGLPPTGRLLEEFARRIEAAEREACAVACENERVAADETGADSDFAYNQAITDSAAAIRAR